MNIRELIEALPNGLHDADLTSLKLDFVKQQAQMQLDVWIGDDLDVEAYRAAEVTLTGLAFWIVETPDAERFSAGPGAIRIDVGLIEELPEDRRPRVPSSPNSTLPSWIYVNEWNAFMYFAAEQAALRWTGDRYVREFEQEPDSA